MFFMSTVSIRGFLAILVIADAKTRKLWKFSTHGKHLPLNMLRFFLSQVRSTGRPTLRVSTDLGGE